MAVLLSGGVDSSVALRLALAAGHAVKAFYLQIWFQEDFRNTWDACPWEEDLGYAKQVRRRQRAHVQSPALPPSPRHVIPLPFQNSHIVVRH